MTHDPVNNPAHYIKGRKYEPADVIHDWDLGFFPGNAVKYISRAGRKSNDAVQDLEKAVWYLQREIRNLKAALPKVETTEARYMWATIQPDGSWVENK